jgi:hypothetical protein
MKKQNKINKDEIILHYTKVKNFATLHNIKLKDFDYKKYF